LAEDCKHLVAARVLATIGYYGLKYFRETCYQDERAFRVLCHVVGQFGDLQDAMADAARRR
jgi:hypothetical protein